jgi:hypothetical protein
MLALLLVPQNLELVPFRLAPGSGSAAIVLPVGSGPLLELFRVTSLYFRTLGAVFVRRRQFDLPAPPRCARGPAASSLGN